MNLDELTLDARILEELGKISAGLKHVMETVSDIKTEIRDIKDSRNKMEERVRKLEAVQAECRGKNIVAVSAINKATAIFAGIVSAIVAWLVAFFTRGMN